MNTFQCIALNDTITARRCIDEQINNRCFCSKAVYAINAYAETYDRTSVKQREDLDVVRARACSFYKRPAGDQYAGPALEAQRAKEVPPCAEPIPATGEDTTKSGTAPAVEPVETQSPEVPSGPARVCQFAGCGRHLRVDNESGYCRGHRQSHQIEGACSVEGCGKKAHGRGMCFTHYQRDLRDRKREGNVVPIKEAPVEVETKTIEREKFGDWRERGIPVGDLADLPDIRTLPHEYLVACCKEARRRIEEMDVLFTFTTQAKGA